ncbi:MarR family transcriptional regulator [Maritimibacter sp. 55A14]|uniref:MarR family winged helix-turn-helix transcriptional regulator n=1 Tax=Maritimibacter sp. 55A14 TaxID=2174844 RepID=UPI000D61981E|nr:MarR family transcriptional regulator [Maritimibacter sp. 55A14]PWE30509.1 MarR family transcriptional regulator [Maritimibacter sp. 55A14]
MFSDRPAKSEDPIPEATPEYILDEQVGYLLRLASQRHAAIFAERALLELSAMQFSTLIRLSDEGECSQNHLGRLVAMDVATIKGVVDRLKRKGLVTLRPDPGDKRRTLISLSQTAKDALPELSRMGREITRETLAPLSVAERKTFLELLKKLV